MPHHPANYTYSRVVPRERGRILHALVAGFIGYIQGKVAPQCIAARTSITVCHGWAEPQWGQGLFPTEALAWYRGCCVANAGCKRVSACVGELSLPIEGDATKTHYLARELLRGREPLSKAARRTWATARFRGRPHTLLVGARCEFSQRQ